MIRFLFSPSKFKFKKMSQRNYSDKSKYSDYDGFQKILNSSRNIVVLTGAGISAESGIPVFRGAGGLWRNYNSQSLATPEAFKSNPSLVWEFYNYRRHIAFNAKPNNAHLALAEYEKRCKIERRNFSVITQNVDGLHFRAGSEKVLELHGALRKVACTNMGCNHVEENHIDPIIPAFNRNVNSELDQTNLPVIEEKDLPKCSACGFLARPFIVWFGERLDEKVLDEALKYHTYELVSNCDLCLVIGTSSVVYPAAMFAPLASLRGIPVAEFNIEEHPASPDFEFHFSGPCGTTVPKAFGIDL